MVRFERLDDWLRWQESCHPVTIDLGLERVREVALRLGLLPARSKVITVAGTNGKGTCVAALEQLLLATGQTCGVYSSPHILHYRERIRLNGQFATDDDICRAFAAIDEARGDISLTYFEFGTLAALYLFHRANVSYWVLEVGLGGRLDATNIVDANIAVITSIALDHTEWLGPDRESIGREKAGICRPGIPLVCADFDPPNSLLETAAQLQCTLFRIDEDFGFDSRQQGTVFWLGDLLSAPVQVNLPCPSLAAALQVGFLLNLFSDLPVTAFERIVLAGRLQYVNVGGRNAILDVAHNPAAFAYLARQLQSRHPDEKFVVVVAMMADKDLSEALAAFGEIVVSWHLATIPGFARAASTAQLRQALPTNAAAAEYASVAEALTAVLHSDSSAPVLITGSFYTVADATRFLQHRETAIETVG